VVYKTMDYPSRGICGIMRHVGKSRNQIGSAISEGKRSRVALSRPTVTQA